MTNYNDISVKELKQYFDQQKDFILLDVREKFELKIASITNSIHIPMIEIPTKLNQLNPKKEIIVLCKSGVRSAQVCEYLCLNNFDNVKNVKGGIKAWALEVDNSISLY
tara:strand:- start:738 stop:1064 length:327 start_codon:yes stop_codon:yes gene_type:complete